ncbi:S-adenosylmethionine:tRNA ribosyltransferase-isomerase [Candidatus Shikimatogenerans bostrichidophilus]|uniref:S-adenosylmethionine:tRNA ribosyltransferase-isomerase n=1 Tax=Candidatus Shikimatogenerans bostrichidophilus TaxID=2943807 RepID=UPI002965F575
MKINKLYFKIPKFLIKYFPYLIKDNCKLMIFDRKKKKIYHKNINYLIKYFKPNDLLIRNNTKILPCKLIGYKNNSKISLFLLKNINKSNNIWETLISPARKIRIGNEINFFYNKKLIVTSKIIDNTSSKGRIIKFLNINYNNFIKVLYNIGNIIVPNYFNFINSYKNYNYFQNIYAKKVGSLFLPTSGINLSKNLFLYLKYKSVKILDITYHFGISLYNIINNNNFNFFNKLNSDFLNLNYNNIKFINNAFKKNYKICAIDINTLIALELCKKYIFNLINFKGYINNLINIPYNYNIVNNLLTYFHYPNTYYFHLLADYCGYNNIINIYNEAIKYNYSFFYFGDLLLVKL